MLLAVEGDVRSRSCVSEIPVTILVVQDEWPPPLAQWVLVRAVGKKRSIHLLSGNGDRTVWKEILAACESALEGFRGGRLVRWIA